MIYITVAVMLNNEEMKKYQNQAIVHIYNKYFVNQIELFLIIHAKKILYREVIFGSLINHCAS